MFSERARRVINLFLSGIVLVLGTTLLVWMVATKRAPQRRVAERPVPRVEVLPIQPRVFEAPIVGYGTIRPKRQVKIIPEVSGKLISVNQDLAVGNIIDKGELLFEIDPRVYQSKVRQVEADIARLQTQLKRHNQERASLKERLELAVQRVELSKKRVVREEDLLVKGSGTAPESEAAKEMHLRDRDAVLEYQIRLALIPLQIEETTAMLETQKAQLEEARMHVEKTKISCPFDARVDAVGARESQTVIANLQIATLTDVEAFELSVVVDPRELQWTDREALASATGDDPETAPEARVMWTILGREFSWKGKVSRLERLDEITRTAHMVVEIRDVLRSLDTQPGRRRLPLSVGMFCRAELPTEPLQDALVVPRHAIHDGKMVYVYEPDDKDPFTGRLTFKRIMTHRRVGDEVLAAFRSDQTPRDTATDRKDKAGPLSDDQAIAPLNAGDLVIVSPLTKVVKGMRLALRRTDDQAIALRPSRQRTGADELPTLAEVPRHVVAGATVRFDQISAATPTGVR